jgi:hypothetical protein
MTQVIDKEKVNVKANEDSERKARLEKLRANLAKLKEVKKEQSTGFVKIQPGETKILEFTGDVEAVQKTFKRKNEKTGLEEDSAPKTLFAYKVIDTNNRDAGVQTWEISRQWSDTADNLLQKGFLTLEIKRTGASMNDTHYLISPVVSTGATGGAEYTDVEYSIVGVR